MLKFEKINGFFVKSINMTVDETENFIKKSDLWHESINKFEIKLFTCAHFFNNKIEGFDIEDVNYFNNFLIVNLTFVAEYEFDIDKKISQEYIKKRLLEYKDDIEKCKYSDNQLPKYTYCSIFKSHLNEFDLNESKNLNILDIYKLKLYLVHWSDFVQKCVDSTYKIIKSEI